MLSQKRFTILVDSFLVLWYMTLPTVQQQKSYCRKTFSSKHLLGYFAKMPVGQVEADDMERYRERRRSEGAADGTIDLEVSLLRRMYNLARKRKKIPFDAVPGEFVMKNETNPRRLITDAEYESLLEHAGPDFHDVLVCGYESAMRSSEIGDLRANQVHLDVQHISGDIVDYVGLGIFDTKNKTERTVPVSPRLKEILQRRLEGLEPEAYVFTHDGHKYTNMAVSARMQRLCKRAKVEHGDKLTKGKGERAGIVFHCLRHTRTTKWVEAGYSDEIIRRATGHKSLEAYRNYVRLDPSAVMRLVTDQKPKRDKNGTKTAESLC